MAAVDPCSNAAQLLQADMSHFVINSGPVQDTLLCLVDLILISPGNGSLHGSYLRGKTVTVICAMSASGSLIPPLFIFPLQRHSPHLEKDGPLGAVYISSHNGWTNEKIFILCMYRKRTTSKCLAFHQIHHTVYNLLTLLFILPLKRAYNKECNMYMKSRNLIKITPYEIAGLFNKAYTRVASIEKGVSSFKVT
ncbi:hypothetical protein NQ318_006973 [Aromia moschata]|uniref:DDE-1 domain-containing protein n=1 Tax=Aromia moschata TaxID=1265417 RepID=A0AAV8Y8R3_9CUCU|nr:hypothetical protein NQ318_006973 [Aromia moschata]